MGPKITFKRITNPKSSEFEQLWKIYCKCFPIEDERDTRKHFEENTRRYSFHRSGSYVEGFLISVNVNGKPAGGAVFDYVEGSICGRKTGFGIGWYIFIDKTCRERGLGSLTQKKHIEILKETARKRGAKLDMVVYELNDPERMKPAEIREDRMVMHAEERLEFFRNFGFRRIKGISYIQPQLKKKSKPYEGLMLCILPLRKDFRKEIPAEYLKQLLGLYVWAGFAGIPGSDVNGRRNPDTDSAYLRMRSQLDSFGKSACLRLVSV